jgi:uncharacterized membrane protein YkvA (DUF1232 family)
MFATLRRMFWYTAILLYLVFPIDFLPDIFPVLGWIDDVAVIAYGISQARAVGSSSRALTSR